MWFVEEFQRYIVHRAFVYRVEMIAPFGAARRDRPTSRHFANCKCATWRKNWKPIDGVVLILLSAILLFTSGGLAKSSEPIPFEYSCQVTSGG